MDKKTEALKLALEALERCVATCFDRYAHEQVMSRPEHFVNQAITAIREALAEQPAQQQEPYGWKVYGVNSLFMGEFAEADAKAEAKRIGGTCIAFPLYTSPPASKPWVGLDDTDLAVCDTDGVLVARYWEWVLRKKNAQPSKPLTDEQIMEMYNEPRSDAEMLEFARAIEAKLKERNT